MVGHLPLKQKILGSSPSPATIDKNLIYVIILTSSTKTKSPLKNNFGDKEMKTRFLGIVVCLLFCILICGCMENPKTETPQVEPLKIEDSNNEKPTKMVIGLSKIEVESTNNVVLGVQVDRVIRDYLWENSSFDVRVAPNRIPLSSLQVVPYMEGARTRELMDWAKVSVLPLTPCNALLKEDGNYYGNNGKDSFSFLVLPDKVAYPTSVFSTGKNHVVIHDTHGFSAIAEQAYINKDKVSITIACMDTPDKANAALWLAQNGIHCYAPCDKFAFTLMNYKQRFGIKTEIIGSAPIKKTEYGAVIGNQPVTILLSEKILAQFTDAPYPDQYCNTPSDYFRQLQKTYNVTLKVTEVYANVGQTNKIVTKAEEEGINVIAVRVYNEDDYWPVRSWLHSNKNNRAILFHSVAYESGVKLFNEFPEQTSFGDLNPKFI
jgi:hypothetical protein